MRYILLALAVSIPLSTHAHPCGGDSTHQWQMLREQKQQTKLLKQLRDDQQREAIRNEYRDMRSGSDWKRKKK